MKNAQLISALTTIATLNPEGYTVDAKTLQPITRGYAVAVAATQNSFGLEGLQRVINYVATHEETQAFGGWYNSEDGQFYFDATVIVATKAEAMVLAQEGDQYAFYCLHEGKQYDKFGNEIKD